MSDQSSFVSRAILSTNLALAALLAACGGGGDESSTNQRRTAPPVEQVPPGQSGVWVDVSRCFKLSDGVQYEMSTGERRHVTKVIFNGHDHQALSRTNPREPGERDFDIWTEDQNQVRFVGEIDREGTRERLTTYEGRSIPSTMQSGTSLQVAYKEVSVDGTEYETDTVTFYGVENLMLGGQLFENVCHFSMDDADEDGERDHTWFAEGYGPVKHEERYPTGATVPNSTEQLAHVMAPLP